MILLNHALCIKTSTLNYTVRKFAAISLTVLEQSHISFCALLPWKEKQSITAVCGFACVCVSVCDLWKAAILLSSNRSFRHTLLDTASNLQTCTAHGRNIGLPLEQTPSKPQCSLSFAVLLLTASGFDVLTTGVMPLLCVMNIAMCYYHPYPKGTIWFPGWKQIWSNFKATRVSQGEKEAQKSYIRQPIKAMLIQEHKDINLDYTHLSRDG